MCVWSLTGAAGLAPAGGDAASAGGEAGAGAGHAHGGHAGGHLGGAGQLQQGDVIVEVV